MSELLIGGSAEQQITLLTQMANRHGLIAGATGTGKTVTLQILAEAFSRAGVPVFAADMKGDLSGLAATGKPHAKVDERIQQIGITDYQARPCPVVLWDVFGKQGHPLRTTISEVGPLLLSSLLELNETQSGVLYACFRIADDDGLLLLDLKDLRSMLSWVAEHAKELRSDYGNLSASSIAAIQRRLLVLEEQGASEFFGEPALQFEDLLQFDFSGNAVINILDAASLSQTSPKLYSTFLLWLLAELFEELPEVGDQELPKMVFFFDEAHLLFSSAPKPLLDKVEQVVRLIRSKGVGIYFISQNPMDIPDDVLGQLGLRIQHALRAFTPKDRKAIKATAENFRANPAFDTVDLLTSLGTGEALVSVLDEKGSPGIVQRTLIRPPESRIGPLTAEERQQHLKRSPMKGKYDTAIDRESAYEKLKQRAEKASEEAQQQQAAEKAAKANKPTRSSSSSSRRQGVGEALMKSVARSVGSSLGRRLVRGLLGSLLGKG